MIDRDAEISMILNRLVPASGESGAWERVLIDAGELQRMDSRGWRSARLALVLAALAALAVALAFVPALAGQGYFWFLDHGAPEPTTPVVTIASITDRSGMTWQLTAYREERGLCFQLTTEGRNGMGACASDLPLNAAVYGDAKGAFILGPVTSAARSVVIAGSGQHVETNAVPAPAPLQTDIKFYVTQLPEGMADGPMTVKALDEQGDVVATWAVPGRRSP